MPDGRGGRHDRAISRSCSGSRPTTTSPQLLLLFFAARRFIECVGLDAADRLRLRGHPLGTERARSRCSSTSRSTSATRRCMLVAAARPELLDAHPTLGQRPRRADDDPARPAAAARTQRRSRRSSSSSAGEPAFDLARLVEVAGGNPLFLEELAASVVELGDGGDLPVTVREAIAARIDAMPAGRAQRAPVRRGDREDVLARRPRGGRATSTDVDEALGVLEARDFVRRDPSSQLAGDVQFTFKHMLIREVAYATVPRAARRERHAAVARHVEETIAGATETLSPILAYHWREAGEPARAIPYLLAAADAARRGWAQDAVVDLYSTALELADDDELRRQIRLQRGLALVELADYAAAADELGALLPELEGAGAARRADRLGARLRSGPSATPRRSSSRPRRSRSPRSSATRRRIAAALAAESQALGDARRRGRPRAGARARRSRARASGCRERGRSTSAHHLHLHADVTYWVGEYERSRRALAARRGRSRATSTAPSRSCAAAGSRRSRSPGSAATRRRSRSGTSSSSSRASSAGARRVVLNYSSLAYRELYDLDEARARSEEALELSAGSHVRHADAVRGSDLIFTPSARGRRRRGAGGLAGALGERERGDRLDDVADRRTARRRPRRDRAARRDSGDGGRVGAAGARDRAPDAPAQVRGALAVDPRPGAGAARSARGSARSAAVRRRDRRRARRPAGALARARRARPGRVRARRRRRTPPLRTRRRASSSTTFVASSLPTAATSPTPRRGVAVAGKIRLAFPRECFVTVGDVMVDVVCDRAAGSWSSVRTARSRCAPAGRPSTRRSPRAGSGADAQVVGRIGTDAAGDLVVSTLERTRHRRAISHGIRQLATGAGDRVAVDASSPTAARTLALSPDDLPVAAARATRCSSPASPCSRTGSARRGARGARALRGPRGRPSTSPHRDSRGATSRRESCSRRRKKQRRYPDCRNRFEIVSA